MKESKNPITLAASYSEVLLFDRVSPASNEGSNKELLGKKMILLQEFDSHLCQIESDADWQDYTYQRLEVEQRYGLELADVIQQINKMKLRQGSLKIWWYFLTVEHRHVGAVGLLLYDYAGNWYGRLQDVDIFPAYRGHNYGNLLLSEVEQLAAKQGVDYLFIGADDGDWPIDWYKRRGYETLAVVSKVKE